VFGQNSLDRLRSGIWLDLEACRRVAERMGKLRDLIKCVLRRDWVVVVVDSSVFLELSNDNHSALCTVEVE
jgi:hypothetical protein